MSHNTTFQLFVLPENRGSQIKLGLQGSIGKCLEEVQAWPSHEKDGVAVSSRYPDVLFRIECDRWWKEYFGGLITNFGEISDSSEDVFSDKSIEIFLRETIMDAQQCRERMIALQPDQIKEVHRSPEYIDLMIEINDAIEMNAFLYRCPNPIPSHNVESLYEVLKSEGFSIQTNIIDGVPQDIISWYPPKDNSDDRGNTVAKIVYGDDPRFKSTGWVCRTGPRSETPVDLYGMDGKKFAESNNRSPLIYPDLGEGEFLMDEDETSYTIGKTVVTALGSDSVSYETTHRLVKKEAR